MKLGKVKPVLQDDTSLLRLLELSNTKLDELSAFQLMQGVLAYSTLESLNLSNNPQLGYTFSHKLIEMVEKHSQKFLLSDLDL